jgi:hypothetical protein
MAARTRRRTVEHDPKDPRVLISAKLPKSLRKVYKEQDPNGNAWLEETLTLIKKRRQRKGKK